MRMRLFALSFGALFLVCVGPSAVPATAQTARFICSADENGKPVNCVTTAGVSDPATQRSDEPPPRKRPSYKRTRYQKSYNQQPMYQQPQYQQPAYQQPTYQQPYYQQPYQMPAYYPQQPYQQSCCCPTARRGFPMGRPVSPCGYSNSYPQYPVQAPYPQYPQYSPPYQPYPPYYYPQMTYPQPQLQVRFSARTRFHQPMPRRHCSHVGGRWICR